MIHHHSDLRAELAGSILTSNERSAAETELYGVNRASLIEQTRQPLSEQRVAVSMAEAALNGLISRYTASRSAADATAICWAQIRVNEARQALDRVRALAIVAIGDAARAEAI
jgi:hypothetical protein